MNMTFEIRDCCFGIMNVRFALPQKTYSKLNKICQHLKTIILKIHD